MDNIFSIIKLCLPFILICFVIARTNIDTKYRSRQFLMPIIAIVLSIAAMFKLTEIHQLISDFIENNDLIIAIIKWITETDENYSFILTYIFNTVVALAFLIIKLFLRPFLLKFWSNDDLLKETSARFYEPLPDYSSVNNDDSKSDDSKTVNSTQKKANSDENKPEYIWCLKHSFEKYNLFFKGFYYSTFIVSVIVFILSQRFSQWPVFQAVFYPIFGIIILGEIYFFLCGPERPTAPEPAPKPKLVEAPHISDVDFLRKELRLLAGDKNLFDNFSDNISNISSSVYSFGSSLADKIAQAYFSHYNNLDENYIKSAIKLVDGQSVLISNPFYRDLTLYFMLPVMVQILSYKKCLIICGRETASNDILLWIKKSLSDITGTDRLWDAEILSEASTSAEIGILRASDIYHIDLLLSHADFFQKTGIILLIEPSNIIVTGHLGLSLIQSLCESANQNIVYCACDRNCDGIVDALSHTFKTSITEVTATLHSKCQISRMFWESGGSFIHQRIPELKDISRYLGSGTEFSLMSIRHLAKHHVNPAIWVSCEKFPVLDMKWIAGQYFHPMSQFAHFANSQAAFENAFRFEPNLWSLEKSDGAFMTVEDEFNNLFETSRIFESRANNVVFINTISDHYFLRDYMVNNADVFMTDPKAIPAIIPDYARTPRNIILRLLIMLSQGPLDESFIKKEFELCHRKSIICRDIPKTLESLIKTYSLSTEILKNLVQDESIETTHGGRITHRQWMLRNMRDIYKFITALKPAFFFTEDENDNQHPLAARLFSHIYQLFLPGQYITLDGKYYQVLSISNSKGVILRRSSDYLTQRVHYRQLRSISMDVLSTERNFSVGNIEYSYLTANLNIQTSGYLQMNDIHDFKTARSFINNEIPERNYYHKTVLQIRIPNATPDVRFTICLLLNEIFRTIYPNAWQYICAVMTDNPEESLCLKDAIYKLTTIQENAQNEIYIIEDSEIDLGLIESVERNLKRYLEILFEVLSWHLDKLNHPDDDFQHEESEEENDVENEPPMPVQEPKKSWFKRLIAWFKTLIIPPNEVIDTVPQNEPEPEMKKRPKPELKPPLYCDNCFLRFGYSEMETSNQMLLANTSFKSSLNIEGTIELLAQYGFDQSSLTRIRKNKCH